MAKHPRLLRRGTRYYFRAAVPQDIQEAFGRKEVKFSLQTSDYQEALRKVRQHSAEVDQQFERCRQSQQQEAVRELEEATIRQIGELYYAHLLEEDEEGRLEGFAEQPRPTTVITEPALASIIVKAKGSRQRTFEEGQALTDWLSEETGKQYARGQVDSHFMWEAQEVLSWEGVNIRLAKDSPSWKKLARELLKATQRANEAIQQRNQGKVVDTPPAPQEVIQVDTTPLLSKVVEAWLVEREAGKLAPKTITAYRACARDFIEAVGDKQISQYTKDDIREYKALLLKTPPNRNGRAEFKGLPIRRAAALAAEKGEKPMSARTVNKLLGHMAALWSYAGDNYDGCAENYFNGMKVALKLTPMEERDPFTLEELQAIYAAPPFTGCMSVEDWLSPGPSVLVDSGLYWIPLIGLYSGARSGEIIQLEVADLRKFGDVCYYFDLSSKLENIKRKTRSSWRKVPIHPALIELGLLDYAKRKEEQGSLRLFPEMRLGADGQYSTPYSRYFRQLLDSIGITRARVSFHSLRHNFEDASRDSGISQDVIDALQGHIQAGMGGTYGGSGRRNPARSKGFSLDVLAEEIQKLHYKGLDLSHLKSSK